MRLSHPTNVIVCPVCFTVTGKIHNWIRNSTSRHLDIEFNDAAADPPDGNRCSKHARTKQECLDEAIAAMRWAGIRQ